MASQDAVVVTGGVAKFTGGAIWWKEGLGSSLINASAGTVVLDNLYMSSHAASGHTAAFVHQSGTAVLVVNGCYFGPGITAPAIQMDTTTVGSSIGPNNQFNSMTISGVGLPASTFPAPVNNLIAAGTLYVGQPTAQCTLVIRGPKSTQRQFLWQNDTVNLWRIALINTETGSGNAGADWQLSAYNDAGTVISNPLTITRSSGAVALSGPLTASAGPIAVGSNTLATAAEVSLNTASGQVRRVRFQTAGSDRFQCLTTASDNFALQTYNPPGTLLGNSLSVASDTGLVTLGLGATISQLNVSADTGPNIRSGTGAATGTQPSGSIWLRTDGSAGARMYVSQGGGTWIPVASV